MILGNRRSQRPGRTACWTEEWPSIKDIYWYVVDSSIFIFCFFFVCFFVLFVTFAVGNTSIDNQFPVPLVKHKASVRCLDLSSSRKRLAIVDESNVSNPLWISSASSFFFKFLFLFLLLFFFIPFFF